MVEDFMMIHHVRPLRHIWFLYPIKLCKCLTHRGWLYYVLSLLGCSSPNAVDSLSVTSSVVALSHSLGSLGGPSSGPYESSPGERCLGAQTGSIVGESWLSHYSPSLMVHPRLMSPGITSRCFPMFTHVQLVYTQENTKDQIFLYENLQSKLC